MEGGTLEGREGRRAVSELELEAEDEEEAKAVMQAGGQHRT